MIKLSLLTCIIMTLSCHSPFPKTFLFAMIMLIEIAEIKFLVSPHYLMLHEF